MSAFAITVDFTLKPGALAAFRKLIDKNAQESCAHEPGCRRFDVLVPIETGDKVFLYEIYADRAAFDAHLKTPHFDMFNRESEASFSQECRPIHWSAKDRIVSES
jgi:quinol monooxygenase YgiN